MKVSDIKSIRIKLASPENILSWSHGEVKKPETINYRTQRPEKDGLFCEKIFGPSKDFECYCGKYKGIRYKGVVCDRCGVEVTTSSVRRERMGHIKLAAPCSHIWFLRGVPSRLGMLLNLSREKLEKVIYFAAYIIKTVNEKARKQLLQEIEKEKEQELKKLSSSELSDKEKIKRKKEIIEKSEALKEQLNSLKPLQVLSEPEYRELSMKYGEAFEATTGAEGVLEIVKKINLKEKIKELEASLEKTGPANKIKTLRRIKFLKGMLEAGIKPEWMFLKVLPVLPADLRPMVQLDGGRYASSDLNDLYRRVINRNNRLKHLLEISAPEVIIRNEKRMLQEAVDSLLDNRMRKSYTTQASTGGRRLLKSLADILEGKQGRFRRNLLGKRVDYSARSVIAPEPNLRLYQCGLPKIMALELFRPFVIKKLLDQQLAYNVRGASRLIEEGTPEVFAALEQVVKGRLVLLNRAPTLHRLSIQAFEPVLVEGKAIKIHPLVCKAYNADFDGDQMAVYLPLSENAQKEAKTLMLSSKNILKPATGKPITGPTKDIVLGCYYLTGIDPEQDNKKKRLKTFSSPQEALFYYNVGEIPLRKEIYVYIPNNPKPLKTTPGRLIFNEILPSEIPFINKQMDEHALSQLLAEAFNILDQQKMEKLLDDIKELGFQYATLSAVTWGMDDLIVPPQKKELVRKAEKEVIEIEKHFERGLLSEKEKRAMIIQIWHEVKEKIEDLVKQTLPKDGPVRMMVESGARGSWAQPVQMAGMKGLVTSPAGKTIELPVISSFKEGFDVLEYFNSTHGARKGTTDTALRTAKSGYLTRRLVDVSHEVIVREKDCGDKEGRVIYKEDAQEINQNFVMKILGRIALEDIKSKKEKTLIVKKGEEIDPEKAKRIAHDPTIKTVRVRSPLSCQTRRGVCQKCYGWELGRNKLVSLGEAVGIIAAQSIGEPGTQLTMRTFHLGGVAGGGDITQGLPRIEEIFECREPKGKAPLVLKKGRVTSIDPEKGEIVVGGKKNGITYKIPPDSQIYVKKGQEVKPGQPLCSGSLDLEKLFQVSGIAETQRYILKEIQRIYAGEGIDIHDKHIEIIVRQMFSRVRIVDGGDGPWIKGEIVNKAKVEQTNEELKKQNKKPALFQPILLGISRVALTSESFLSAASFQSTSRVLIKAATEGAEDKLYGLKENVIIGRLVPAGTGFREKK